MQPDHVTWDDFTARQTAPEAGDLAAIASRSEPERRPKLARNKRTEPSLSALLLQAIQAAGVRRGRLSRAERIREATLLEVLSTAMRSAR
jgi:hypothetical protein